MYYKNGKFCTSHEVKSLFSENNNNMPLPFLLGAISAFSPKLKSNRTVHYIDIRINLIK